jgi:hypothetical protein
MTEFLRENPHFVAAAPAGSGTRSNANANKPNLEVDISRLDMKNPEHRKIYAEYRKQNGIA